MSVCLQFFCLVCSELSSREFAGPHRVIKKRSAPHDLGKMKRATPRSPCFSLREVTWTASERGCWLWVQSESAPERGWIQTAMNQRLLEVAAASASVAVSFDALL